jgi:putative restriction endonuclease
MRAFVGITDYDWFKTLSAIPNIDEVNFWQPSGSTRFRALDPGELFLFKLHSPLNFIVGGGLFAYSNIIPVNLAWDAFGEKNGAHSLAEMRRLIENLRPVGASSRPDYQIGCILLEQPFFFSQSDWIRVPSDWSPNIVRGKGYDLSTEVGLRLWNEVHKRLQMTNISNPDVPAVADGIRRYGEPTLIIPRLGQGTFRIMVTDAYQRRCAVTRERTLPALEAVHIRRYNDSGPHDVRNGLLLRSDIHKLFDTGYVTISSDYHFEVSRRIKEEFENGRDYYALHGKPIQLPGSKSYWPDSNYVSWHNENIFRD